MSERPAAALPRGRPARAPNPFGGLAAIALGEARHALAQPRLLVFLILLPIVFSSVLSLFYGGGPGPVRVLVSGPATPLASALVAEIEGAGGEIEPAGPRAGNLIARNERDVWLRLPADFDARIKAGERAEIGALLPPGSLRSGEVLERLRAAAARLEARFVAGRALREVRPSATPAEVEDAGRRAARLLGRPVLSVRVEEAVAARSASAVVPSGPAQTTPGMTLMFALLFGAQTGLALQRERRRGTLARLHAAPLSGITVIAGKLLGNAAILLLQLAAMVAFGGLVLGVRWGNVAALVAPAFGFALAASALGAACAALTRTPAQLSSFSILAVTTSAALGGLWWPLEVTPAWMQTLARGLPTFWGMDAFQDVMLRGAGVVAVLPHAAVLLGFAALFAAVGARAYRTG